MAISKNTKRSPAGSKCKKGKNWDGKRNLAKKRLMSNDGFEDMDKPIICYKAKENKISGTGTSVDVSTSALELAEEVRKNLPLKVPSFAKLMLRSHVTKGFWLGLPKEFCDKHLPEDDDVVSVDFTLVDEKEKRYIANYLVKRAGLSGGWKGFSVAHELLEGDALVFQLIEAHTFKVYIVRARKLTEIDGALSRPTLDYHTKRITDTQMEDREKYQEEPVLISDEEAVARGCDEDSDDSCSETVERIRFSESVVTFEDMKGFENFTIHVDGLILDSEIPFNLMRKYYELCCSQNMFLHDPLIEGLTTELAIGIISETVTIADAIRAVKSTTPPKDLESWDQTLKSFQDLGMMVGFLRDRIHKLLSFSRVEAKRVERDEAEVKMRSLKDKHSKVGGLIKKLDTEIGELTGKNEEQLCLMFTEVAGASW